MITNSRIAQGDLLGAQMITVANLIFLSEINNQELGFFDELKNFRRGYQFLDVFDCDGIKVIPAENHFLSFITERMNRINSADWKKGMKETYFSKMKSYKDKLLYELISLFHLDFKLIKGLSNHVHCDDSILHLDVTKNYDIIDGFGTYQDWKTVENRVKNTFKFKKEFVHEGDKVFNNLNLKGLEPVSIHFRLADYLVLSSLNLSLDYYRKALEYYDANRYMFIVFSDEIEKVKEYKLFNNYNVIYMDGKNSAAVDMYLMTRCLGGNIIANSSFSFWGGFLNASPSKKVVCPKNFVSEDSWANYLNGNYYPESWIAL